MKSTLLVQRLLMRFGFLPVVALSMWASTGYTQTFTSSDTPLAIPDGSPAGITSSIIVQSSSSTVFDLDVSFTTDHTWVGDLTFRVTSPAGTTVDLVVQPGGTGDSSDFAGIYSFDDDALMTIHDVAATLDGAGVVPSGIYHPATSNGALSFLDAFNGEIADGVWSLFVSDGALIDDGTLTSWSLDFAFLHESTANDKETFNREIRKLIKKIKKLKSKGKRSKAKKLSKKLKKLKSEFRSQG